MHINYKQTHARVLASLLLTASHQQQHRSARVRSQTLFTRCQTRASARTTTLLLLLLLLLLLRRANYSPLVKRRLRARTRVLSRGALCVFLLVCDARALARRECVNLLPPLNILKINSATHTHARTQARLVRPGVNVWHNIMDEAGAAAAFMNIFLYAYGTRASILNASMLILVRKVVSYVETAAAAS